MEATNKIVSDDFQGRKEKVEGEFKTILEREGLGMQAIIQRTDVANTATLIFLDIRQLEANAKEEVGESKVIDAEIIEETKVDEKPKSN